MSNTKGQAIMEFLMTYGWAILVVIVIVGALFYYGVFNPKSFVYNEADDTCEAFKCEYRGHEAETGQPLASSYRNATCPETLGRTGMHKTREKCLSYHEKTPEEREAYYCNTNSTDSERCFCLEKKNFVRANITTIISSCIPIDNLLRIGTPHGVIRPTSMCLFSNESQNFLEVEIEGETTNILDEKLLFYSEDVCVNARPYTDEEKEIRTREPSCFV